MECTICGMGQTRPGEATVALTRGETTVVVKQVPAQLCENCGEPYLEDPVAANVLAYAERAASNGAEVEIVRYAA